MDLLLLVGLVGGVGSVVGVVLAQALQDDRPVRARNTAENLARQIEARQMIIEKRPQKSARGPASVDENLPPALTDGSLGRDPWGRPYHYTVRKDPAGEGKTKVFVWSEGPNGKPESQATIPFKVDGDDIGHAREFAIQR